MAGDGNVGWRLVADDPPDEARCREVAAFMRRVQESPDSYPKEKDRIFIWKLRENVTHTGFASLMVTTDGDQIVSLCTVTPKRLWYRDSEQPWAEIGDTFTDSAFQRRGMFAAVTDASRARAQAAGFPIIYGLPNEKSLPPYIKKLNFAVKPDIDQQEYLIVLSSRALMAWLSARGYRRAGDLAGSPTAAALSRTLLAALLRTSEDPDLRVSEERMFGEEYDALWRRVRADLQCAQVRDARYLGWRYRANPFQFRVLAARRKNSLKGYAVILTAPSESGSEPRRMYLMDWLFPAAESSTVGRALLRTVLRMCIDEGVDVLAAHNARRSPLRLPWPRGLTIQRPVAKPVIVHRSAAGQALLADDVPWHLTLSDTDAF